MKSFLFVATATVALGATSASNAALVYGGGTETGSRFNAGADAITYMNCFTAVTAGQTQLAVDSAIVGIRRLAAAGALTDVGIKIFAAEMTYDGTNFGRGANYEIYSSASLGAGTASATQLVNTGAVSGVTLNLETLSNAGLGGWWIGVQFTGANAGSANNGWRVVNAPTTGASINLFGIFNNAGSGVFQSWFGFGTPAGSSPSRFMVDVNGTLVPAPGAMALLGVAGLVGARRRRS
jgi:MYXO-CTERM domain-containing protein